MAPVGCAAHAGACLAVVMLAATLNGEDPFGLPATLLWLALGLYTLKAAGLTSQSWQGRFGN
jgi:hypothetical protein